MLRIHRVNTLKESLKDTQAVNSGIRLVAIILRTDANVNCRVYVAEKLKLKRRGNDKRMNLIFTFIAYLYWEVKREINSSSTTCNKHKTSISPEHKRMIRRVLTS